MISNTNKHENLDMLNRKLKKIFPEILKYLKSIFKISFEGSPKNPTIENVATFIIERIWNSDPN